MDQSLPIDDYEARSAKFSRRTRHTSNQNQNNNDQNSRTKRPDELILSRHDRETLLYEWGVTFPEMIEAIRSNVKIKNQRRRTVHAIGTYDRIEEMMEITAHKLKFGKSKKTTSANHHHTTTTTAAVSIPPPAAATHHHPKPPSQPQQRQPPQKRAILLHSNHATNDSKELSLLVVRSSSGSSGNSRDNHSFGSDSDGKVSHSSLHSAASTATSASHVAICCDNDDHNKNKCGGPTPTTVVTMPMDHPDTQSEVNDFNSPVPTPISSVVATTTTTTNETNDNDDAENVVVHAKYNPTVTTNGKHDKNDMNHHHTTTKNDETDMVLTDVATEAKEPPPSRKFHRSRSFDNGHHDDNDDTPRNMYPVTKSRRPATKLAALEPIIGVDIPRDVQLLQRSISVESGLTDHNKYDYSTGHHQREPTDGDNDDVSTLACDMADQYELTERTEDVADETMNDDMTIPSKFIREFNELMMEDSHPKLRNLTPPEKVSPTSEMHDGNIAYHRPSSSPRPADTHGDHHDINDDIDANYNHHHHNTGSKSMTTEDDGIYLHWAPADHPLSPISELTGGDRLHGSFCTRSTASSYMYRQCHPEDGNFDTLQRDSSFWGIRPDETDGPQIQRVMVPVVINEDVSVGESAMDHFMNEPHQLFDIIENRPYHTTEEDFRYPVEHTMYANTTDFPTMMYSNNHALPSTHVFSQHRETQYPLPSVLPTLRTVSGIPPSPTVGSIPVLQPQPHQQQHISSNAGSMHLHSGDGPYPPPTTFPSVVLLHPSPTMRSPVPPNMVESSSSLVSLSLVPPDEAMYNIEQNGQPHAYAIHPPPPPPDNINSHDHHHGQASMYHHDPPPPTVVDHHAPLGTTTTTPPPWHDFGFRSSMEPPPNSTTLFHKMMM